MCVLLKMSRRHGMLLKTQVYRRVANNGKKSWQERDQVLTGTLERRLFTHFLDWSLCGSLLKRLESSFEIVF